MSSHDIEHNLDDPNLILCHAMRIAAQLDAEDGKISDADAAFLIVARDRLNIRAAPATGSSISFTIQVVERLLKKAPETADGKHYRAGYIIPDKSLDDVAVALSAFVRSCLNEMFILLLLAVALSTYVAYGKLLLDTRDAANKDFGANMTAMEAEVSHYSSAQNSLTEASSGLYDDRTGFVDSFCAQHAADIHVHDVCYERAELVLRKNDIHDLLTRWANVFVRDSSWENVKTGEKIEQYATTMVGVVGNYVLPILYGALGSFGFVLRRLNRQLADYLLMPRDLRANHIRIMLGIVTGACIGLFVNSSTGAATLTGLGGAAITLSASGIAFLAGYGVEGVFKMLDALINHVFSINEDRKSGTPS